MKKEIRILLKEGESNKAKGNCFEDLVRNLISIHQYEVRGNINFSGMEIDLIGKHKHTDDTLYVECKAKQKVSSDELTKFAFNVDFKEVDKGYFFRTRELESQAGALLTEIKSKEKYKNLTFFEPGQIIEMLCDAKMIFEPIKKVSELAISKTILAITYFGDFFIYLINESNALPTKFVVINAKNNESKISQEDIEVLKKRIDEIKSLAYIEQPNEYREKGILSHRQEIESISEVQESENWYDYLPASSDKQHFVGRDKIRTSILTFFKKVKKGTTPKRIFYLNGKSGWGKSSLVLEIKGRCRNKHYKNNFYTLAIDTRSAISDNFVALSIKKLISKATISGFIKKDMFTTELSFTSNTDLFTSDSVKKILDDLLEQEKYLVLIFDQFEDVFRKKDYFKTFYKFLSDVTDLKPNLIVGFSWKTDFLVQSGDPSYHIWQQAKEQAIEFTIDEFGEKEILGIIKQLESSVGNIGSSLKNRIIESSQGLPWLTKKLCIHIYDQINSGLTKESLIDSNLNIKDLFTRDEQNLEPEEYQALKLISKRAFDGNFFDESEVGDYISSETVSSLLNKRLVIRSGANYNIYWDIYRDYLVTGEIPTIGESYLLRQGVNLCLEVFLLFEESSKVTIEELLEKHPKQIGIETINNILIELRNLGLVQKSEELYFIQSNVECSKAGFVAYFTEKFKNYTPYIHINKLEIEEINKSDVITILKDIFKQEFQDNTWDAYAKNLMNWIDITDLEVKSKFRIPTLGRRDGYIKITETSIKNFIPRSSFKEILELLPLLLADVSEANSKYYRDLAHLSVIDKDKMFTDFGVELILAEPENAVSLLKEKIESLPKMKKLKKIIAANPKITAKLLLTKVEEDFFDGKKESSKLIYANKAMTWLK